MHLRMSLFCLRGCRWRLKMFVKSENNLENNFKIWMDVLEARKLLLNLEKSITLVIRNKRVEVNATVVNVKVEQVKSYKYLRTVIDSK